mmetsp:Transcript_51039/g.153412  ORF Transcript_51039/g.153412 Transcript_51039/m.153412 type:complete len:286 (+) Transcript_51039:1230-2087(+)
MAVDLATPQNLFPEILCGVLLHPSLCLALDLGLTPLASSPGRHRVFGLLGIGALGGGVHPQYPEQSDRLTNVHPSLLSRHRYPLTLAVHTIHLFQGILLKGSAQTVTRDDDPVARRGPSLEGKTEPYPEMLQQLHVPMSVGSILLVEHHDVVKGEHESLEFSRGRHDQVQCRQCRSGRPRAGATRRRAACAGAAAPPPRRGGGAVAIAGARRSAKDGGGDGSGGGTVHYAQRVGEFLLQQDGARLGFAAATSSGVGGLGRVGDHLVHRPCHAKLPRPLSGLHSND